MWGEETGLEFVRERFKLLLDTHRNEIHPKRVCFRKDQLLIEQGQQADSCFLLLEGKVSIQLHNQDKIIHTLEVIEAEEFLGELALFGRGKHTCDVRIVSNKAEFIQINGADLIKTMIFDSELVIELLALVSERCHKANYLIGLLLDGIHSVHIEDHLSLKKTCNELVPINYSFEKAATNLQDIIKK